MNRWMGSVVIVFSVMAAASAGTLFECNFNDLTDGQIDGQQGWDVFDKVKDSSSCSVVSEVGTTEKSDDKALVVKASDASIRCVTDDAVRWLRKQTATVEFDFRVVVPDGSRTENKPVMVLLLGNSVVSEETRWEIRLEATTNENWRLSAALPDVASAVIPSEKLSFTSGESTILSGWLHCEVQIQKLSKADSFSSGVKITDTAGNAIVELTCSDTDKGKATKAMWNLSRLHAGFWAEKDLGGLACIDNFHMTTEL